MKTGSPANLAGLPGIISYDITFYCVSASVNGLSSERARPSEKKVTWIVKAAPGTHLTITCKNSRIGTCKTEVTL